MQVGTWTNLGGNLIFNFNTLLKQKGELLGIICLRSGVTFFVLPWSTSRKFILPYLVTFDGQGLEQRSQEACCERQEWKYSVARGLHTSISRAVCSTSTKCHAPKGSNIRYTSTHFAVFTEQSQHPQHSDTA